MVIGIVLLVCIVGLLVWFVATNPKVAECGRIMFAFGLLAFLLGADKLLTIINR